MKPSRLKVYWLLSTLIFFSTNSFSELKDYYPYNIKASASNYGNTGIFEIPNARFMKEASLRFNFSSSYPYEFTSLTASPFSWFEATYRYTEIKNRNYSAVAAYSGNQSLKDKGFDIKLKLFDETHVYPALAFGFRDIAGTSLFSSEYLVLTKKINNLDLTLGYGWGVLGKPGSASNPFEFLSDGFKTRELDVGEGGSFSPKAFFSGKTSYIGGLEYDFWKYGLKFKLEYDTSYPDRQDYPVKVDSRINVGLDYFLSENLNLGVAFERGNQFRLSFRFLGNFLEDTIPKPKPKNVIALDKNGKRELFKKKDIFYRSLNRSLRDESIFLQAADYTKDSVSVAISSSRFQSFTRSAGRTARIVSALANTDVETINVHSMNGDLEIAKMSLHRKEFDEADSLAGSHLELLSKSEISSSSSEPLYETAEFTPRVNFPEFNWSMSPAIKHQIGGPEGFYLGQLFWKTDASLKLRRNLVLYSSFGINIYDTFTNFNNPSGSKIPHVRSDIQDYLREGKNNLARLQLQHFSSPKKDIFLRLDAGILEEMFAGFGGEMLYRPFNKRYSFGLSLHKVRQRGYDQRFSFRDYENTTGHIGIYADFPYEVSGQMLIGEYLAGDKGLTLDLSRRFKSGFTLGVFASKTNLSAEEFGEGSFDKGFYIAIPTKMFYSDYTTGNISFGLHPLTKDGAALLNQHNALNSLLGDTNALSLRRDWEDILN